jgi:hypothetical protein
MKPNDYQHPVTDESTVELIAGWYSQLNSSSSDNAPWPLRSPGCSTYGWPLLARLLMSRYGKLVRREISLQASLCMMSVCKTLIGEKEVSRFWNTKHVCHADTNEEFEAWWAASRTLGGHDFDLWFKDFLRRKNDRIQKETGVAFLPPERTASEQYTLPARSRLWPRLIGGLIGGCIGSGSVLVMKHWLHWL